MGDIILWHGSPFIVEKPVYGAGKKYNDYGQGFYCSRHLELAKEWACAERNGGFANRYILNLEEMELVDLQDQEFTTLHWLAVLAANRKFQPETAVAKEGLVYLQKNFLPDLERFDVVRGYRADDSYFSFARAFIGNTISLNQLSRAMRLGELGEQIVLRSPHAFEKIRFDGYVPVDGNIYYVKRKKRDEAARAAYRNLALSADLEGIFIRDILRDKIKPGDSRLN